MAKRNRQAQHGVNFWLSNEECVYLCRLLNNAKKNGAPFNPEPGDIFDEPGMLDDFRLLFHSETPNGNYEILDK